MRRPLSCQLCVANACQPEAQLPTCTALCCVICIRRGLGHAFLCVILHVVISAAGSFTLLGTCCMHGKLVAFVHYCSKALAVLHIQLPRRWRLRVSRICRKGFWAVFLLIIISFELQLTVTAKWLPDNQAWLAALHTPGLP